ncbi:MAG: regulatory iron-sulfur-containing complex subunit RicT [Dehalococcoidia bacterium]|nr:regulatory iron-sulfur-containing complex subunit RicT [Dehalococcoidia bacterium]
MVSPNRPEPAHAMMLIGPDSVGRVPVATRYAMMLNCEAVAPAGASLFEDAPPSVERPCGTCRPCRMIAAGNHPDVLTLAPGDALCKPRPGEASHPSHQESRDIRICQVRGLSELVARYPLESKYRVIFVEPADRLGRDAAHAILKTLEEPPPHTVLLLVTAAPDDIIETIRSRCRQIVLGIVPRDTVEAALIDRGVGPATASRAAAECRGRPGRAVAFAGQPDLMDDRDRFLARCAETAAASMAERFNYAEDLAGRWRRDRRAVHIEIDAWETFWEEQLRRAVNGEGEADPASAAAALQAVVQVREDLLTQVQARIALDLMLMQFPRLTLSQRLLERNPLMPDNIEQIVGIRYGSAGKIHYFHSGGMRLEAGEHVVVESSRGPELARVVIAPGQVLVNEIGDDLPPVLRLATEADLRRADDLAREGSDILPKARALAAETGFQGHIDKAEFTLDRRRLLLSFSSEERVEYREFVRAASDRFGVRVEARHVGARDRARLAGGYGICGRELCCSNWLNTFPSISIRMAKDQDLPLNPQKISGLCGRLLCCLSYEDEGYREMRKTLPRVGQRCSTPTGEGKVVAVNTLLRQITLNVGGQRVEVPNRDLGTVVRWDPSSRAADPPASLTREEAVAQGLAVAEEEAPADEGPGAWESFEPSPGRGRLPGGGPRKVVPPKPEEPTRQPEAGRSESGEAGQGAQRGKRQRRGGGSGGEQPGSGRGQRGQRAERPKSGSGPQGGRSRTFRRSSGGGRPDQAQPPDKQSGADAGPPAGGPAPKDSGQSGDAKDRDAKGASRRRGRRGGRGRSSRGDNA